MQLTELEAFVAVAEQRSFSRAAVDLSVTQPAISKRIKSLEDQLGTTLFDRLGKTVIPTQAGTLLLDRARRILASVVDTRRELKRLDERIEGPLVLATSHHIGLHRLADVLRDFHAEYPQVRPDIRFDDSELAHDSVRRGDAELAVVTLNPRGDADLSYVRIWSDPLVFVTNTNSDNTTSASIPGANPGNHPRSDRPLPPVTMKDLAEQPAILPGPGTYTGRIVLERFHELGLQLKSSLSTNYLETIGMLVGAGLGWSVLPRAMVSGHTRAAAFPVRELQVDTPPMERTLGAVLNPRRTLSNPAAAFLAVLRRYADVGYRHSDTT